MTYEEKIEELTEIDGESIVYNDIQNALIGYLERFGTPPIAIYDHKKTLECLMANGMTAEEAEEWYGYNTLGTWVGEYTPGFLHKFESEESKCLCSRPLKNLWMRTVKRITAILKSFGQSLRRDGK
jgi:hypothetical protein